MRHQRCRQPARPAARSLRPGWRWRAGETRGACLRDVMWVMALGSGVDRETAKAEAQTARRQGGSVFCRAELMPGDAANDFRRTATAAGRLSWRGVRAVRGRGSSAVRDRAVAGAGHQSAIAGYVRPGARAGCHTGAGRVALTIKRRLRCRCSMLRAFVCRRRRQWHDLAQPFGMCLPALGSRGVAASFVQRRPAQQQRQQHGHGQWPPLAGELAQRGSGRGRSHGARAKSLRRCYVE